MSVLRPKYLALLTGILIALFGGCNLLLVGMFGMPGWGCIRVNQPIELFEDIDLSGARPELGNPAATLGSEMAARIIDNHENASGRTTHFRVRTRDGVKGWFAWEGSDFVGWHGTNCW